jgi:hypothetical protein
VLEGLGVPATTKTAVIILPKIKTAAVEATAIVATRSCPPEAQAWNIVYRAKRRTLR